MATFARLSWERRGLATTPLDVREPYYRAGGDFSFNYRTFNIYGVYRWGHDNNMLPVDASGQLIPLPLSGTNPLPVAFVASVPQSSAAALCSRITSHFRG